MAYQVLVVDDMRSIYNSISCILSKRECTVDYASTGRFALSITAEKQYDIIILDIHLPDTNGIAVCETLRGIEAYKHVPILLLTSDTAKLEAGLKAGASDYILKPFNAVEMIARVFTQIKIGRGQQALHLRTTRLENEFHHQKEKLVQAEDELHRYFYQTSHKLRSPINSIKGLLNLLRLEFPEQYNNQYLPLIEEGIGRMEYVNEQVSRIGYLRAHKPKIQSINLNAFLQTLINRLKLTNQIDVSVHPDLNVQLDETVFRYGIEPILSNAIFYNKLRNGGTKKITLKTTSINNMLLLGICDYGPGIPEYMHSQIFDMFYIGNENSEGNGLGLFISKVAMGIMGINISVRSRKGEFTNVILDLSTIAALQPNIHDNYSELNQIEK